MLMSTLKPLGELENPSEFIARHIGISAADEQHMLSVIGEASRRALIESIVPRSIARAQAMDLPAPVTEAAALAARNGIEPHAGHGLTFENVGPIAAIPQIAELNIGHFLIGEAIFIGLSDAIQQMRANMEAARGTA